jgi:hypothetical protein
VSDIFLSYANEDRERIMPLARALEATGWSVFWDRIIPAGKSWRQVIGREIKNCRCVIVAWTSHSVESTWVHEEAEEGKRRDILLPIMLEDVTPPFGFGNIQAADLTDWNHSLDAAAFQALLRDAAQIPGMPARAVRSEAVRRQTVGLAQREVAAATPKPAPSYREASTRMPSDPESSTRFRVTLKSLAIGVGTLLMVILGWQMLPKSPETSSPSDDPGRVVAKPEPESQPVAKTALKIPPASEFAPRSIPAPPHKYFVLDSIGRQPDTQLRLAVVSEKQNKITDDVEWWVANRLEPVTYQRVSGPDDVPDTIPQRYRDEPLLVAIRGNPALAIYGQGSDGRYVLGIDPSNGRVSFAMDFVAFQWPHEFDQSERAYVKMSTHWAHFEAGILYVSHSHNTYARSSKGYNAYLSAVDIQTGTLMWRSQPLTSNTNFLVKGDAIIAGYGFTAEPDFLFVLNKVDGRVVQRVPISSGPSYLVEKDGRLYVRTYNTDYVFRYASQ